MSKQREMIELSVSYSGKVTVKEAEPFCTTQKMYWSNGRDEDGIMYYCLKSKKDYYLKRILNAMKKEVDDELKEVKRKRDKIYKMIQEVNHEQNE